ncbi:MAG TPA: hypothetical protein VHY08_16970 [Bacillota bacterium]|nr:hypothetical protein [Bacillota bacterium]
MAKTTIVVELNQGLCSALEINSRGNMVELVRYMVRDFYENDRNPDWLKRVWQEEHFSHNRVICMLPVNIVKYKTITIPPLPPEQIEAAVQMEYENNSDQSEIVKIINYRSHDQMYQVKVALIKKDLLNQHLHFWQQAGLVVEWSGIRTWGIENFINFNSGFFEDPVTGITYLDITEQQTEFGIVKNEELVYRRDFSLGIQDLGGVQTDGVESFNPDMMSDFLDEVRLSTASYRAAEGELPLKLWLFGEIESVAFLISELAGQFEFKPYVPEKSRLTGVLTQKNTPLLAPLIGLALETTVYFNHERWRIFSDEQTNVKVNRQKVNRILGIGFAGLLFIAGIFFFIQANLERETKITQWLQVQSPTLKRLQQTKKMTGKNQQKIKTLESWLSDQGQELEFMLALQNNLPVGTKITDLMIDEGIVKDLTGITPSASLLISRIKGVRGLEGLNSKGTITNSAGGEVFHLEGRMRAPQPTLIPAKRP